MNKLKTLKILNDVITTEGAEVIPVIEKNII